MTPIFLVIILAICFLIFWLFFNRDPKRKIPKDDVIVSPADGKVIELKDNKIVIFMNLGDVHVQRVPYTGKVLKIERIAGPLFPAYTSKSARNNRIVTKFKTKAGNIEVRQISGILARRIKNYLKIGQQIKTGDKLGKILLGSRIELLFPKGLTIKVKENQIVRAGETIITKF